MTNTQAGYRKGLPMEHKQSTGHGMFVGLSFVMVLGLIGCRASVQKVQLERVDQHPGGNQGFLLGTPPEAPPRSDTREIAELQVLLPGTARRGTRSAPPPPTSEPWLAPTAGTSAETAPLPMETSELYTVKKGDTLWSIARQLYGKGSAWPRIYDANRDQLSEPGRLRAGMRLLIPSAPAEPVTSPPNPYEK